jgi:hypothetical protein
MQYAGSSETLTEETASGTEVAERANELARGFRRLWELGVGTNRIVELTSDDPDEELRRVRAALAELEHAAGRLPRRA